MKLRSTRICKPRAPLRLRADSHQTIPGTRRRSSRLQSSQHILGSYYESQSPLEQRLADPKTSQPVGATSNTRVPISGSVKASAPVPSRVQVQEYLPSPQKHNHQTRKRGPDRSIETGAERHLKRARLTERNLKTFENMGGQARKPAGKKSTGRSSSATTTTDEDLGPQRHQPKSKSSYSGTKSTRSKQTTSTKDSGFLDIAFQNGILNPICSKPPATLESHQERIDRSRETASPSESDYRHFASAIRRAPNEASVLIETSVLLKRYDEPGYQRSYNQAFSNFPKNVGFNNDLSAAQPDMVEGLDMPEFDPFPVREQLGGAATVYSGPQATTLPHLAGEWKGPGKDMILAQTQAGYDGACMVYSRNKARLFLKSPDPTGHAFVSTFTTDGTTLNTFAHYSSESQGQVKYHQYPTSSSFLVSSYPDFKRSRRRLRNLQDDAKETSEKLRDELMEKWLVNQRLDEDEGDEGQESYELVLPAASASTPAENADFANSNGYDYDHGEDPNDQLLTEYWTSFSANHQDESLMPIPTAGNVYTQPSASFQENNPDECLVQIPVGDSVSSLPYASIPANNQDDPSMQIFTSDNGYTSPDALITPPQSSKDTSLPLEAREDIENSNVHGHRRTRRTRTRTADPLEGPREIDHKPNGRKTRRKHYD